MKEEKRKGKKECCYQWTILIMALYVGMDTSLVLTNQCRILGNEFKFYKLKFSHL